MKNLLFSPRTGNDSLFLLIDDEEELKLSFDLDDESPDATSSEDEDDISESDDSEWDEELDELMDWVNDTIISPHMNRRNVSLPELKFASNLREIGQSSVNLRQHVQPLDRMRMWESAIFFTTPQDFALAMQTPKQETDESSPLKWLEDLFSSHGHDISSYETDEGKFLTVTEEHIAAYSLELTRAARSGDLGYLRERVEQGQSLQCCNRHGESIAHIVCRRGNAEILQFLVDKADVSVAVLDDVGRTPLHDAAWTDQPNFELVKYLLEQAPHMMLVRDKRNHSPLSYVPRQRYGVWCDFLKQNVDLLLTAISK